MSSSFAYKDYPVYKEIHLKFVVVVSVVVGVIVLVVIVVELNTICICDLRATWYLRIISLLKDPNYDGEGGDDRCDDGDSDDRNAGAARIRVSHTRYTSHKSRKRRIVNATKSSELIASDMILIFIFEMLNSNNFVACSNNMDNKPSNDNNSNNKKKSKDARRENSTSKDN
ncbi:Hypothetical predicted protein [Octopus vulgaris]|uniref:Uncharacterized protein n=1 Tax=Octopus vulgaris TaxID=6645 RepID=A0AA36F8D7_OCTVU|nr:Hypothetical predicted protein [Octopus vulgaris]